MASDSDTLSSDSDHCSSTSSDSESEMGHELHELEYRYTYCGGSLPPWFHKSLDIAKKEAAEYEIKDNLERDQYQEEDTDEMSEFDEDELYESEEDELSKPIDWSKYRLKDIIMYLIQELCRKDWLPILKLLVKNGLDPKSLGLRYDDCASAEEAVSVLNIVIESITNDQLHFVKYLMKAGWSVNAPPVNERNTRNECYAYPSPLTSALKSKRHNVVKYLIAKGAVLSGVEIQCCGSFNAGMVRMMLQYKPKAEESDLRHLLATLLTRGWKRAKFYTRMLCDVLEWMIPALIHEGINISTQPLRDYIPNHETIAENIINKSMLSDEDITKGLEIMIKYGLDLNNCCIRNDNLLTICIKRKKLKTFELLMEQGMDINYPGGTPLLHHALREGQHPKSRRKDKGHNVYRYNSNSVRLPGYVDDTWFPLLLELGADVNLEDSSGASLYDKLVRRQGENNEMYLMYLLLNTNLRIKPSNLAMSHFSKMRFVTLAVMINAGCRDSNVINAAWRKTKSRDSKRIKLLELADPLFARAKPDVLEGNKNYSQAFLDVLAVSSLLTLCVDALHRYLFLEVTGGKSIVQPLNEISDNLPKELAGVLNFKAFYTYDRDIPIGLKEYLCVQERQ